MNNLIMKTPLVSVIMITYGHEKHIEEAINGVLMQQCNFDVELIIANDCSPDKTDDVIQNILKTHSNSSWIKYIKHEKNIGAMPNVVFSLKEAKGKYIAMCEGDDYWTDPLKLQKQIGFLEENGEYVLTGHKRIIVDEKGNEIIKHKYKIDFYTQCLVFKNLLREDLLNFNYNDISNGDTFLILYLKNFGKAKVLDFIGSAYRISDIGVWSKLDREKKNQLSKESLTAMLKFFTRYKYKVGTKTVKGYLIDNQISYYRYINGDSKLILYKLIFKCIQQKDLNRLKTIVRLLI